MKLSAIAVAAVAAFAASQANAFTVHVACTPNTQWNGVKGTKSFHQVAATSSAPTAVRSTDIIFDEKIVRVDHTLNNGTLIDRSTQYAPDDNSVDTARFYSKVYKQFGDDVGSMWTGGRNGVEMTGLVYKSPDGNIWYDEVLDKGDNTHQRIALIRSYCTLVNDTQNAPAAPAPTTEAGAGGPTPGSLSTYLGM
jgi:hypothetical protein